MKFLYLSEEELNKLDSLPFACQVLYLKIKRACDYTSGVFKTWLSTLSEWASEKSRRNAKTQVATDKNGVNYFLNRLVDLGLIARSGSKTEGVLLHVLFFSEKEISTESQQNLNRISTATSEFCVEKSETYDHQKSRISTESQQNLNRIQQNNHINTNNTNNTNNKNNNTAEEAPAASVAADAAPVNDIIEQAAPAPGEKPKRKKATKSEKPDPYLEGLIQRIQKVVAQGGFIYSEKELTTKIKSSIKRNGKEKVESFIENLEILPWEEASKFYPWSKNESSPHYVFGASGTRDFFDELSAKVQSRVNQLSVEKVPSAAERDIAAFFTGVDVGVNPSKNNAPMLEFEGAGQGGGRVIPFQKATPIAKVDKEDIFAGLFPKNHTKEKEKEYRDHTLFLMRRVQSGAAGAREELSAFLDKISRVMLDGSYTQMYASCLAEINMEQFNQQYGVK